MRHARDNDEGNSVGGTGVIALRMVDGDRNGSNGGGAAWVPVVGCEGAGGHGTERQKSCGREVLVSTDCKGVHGDV